MDNTAQKTESIATITNALMEDLFNPSISTLDLCNLHALSLSELAATLESETFIVARESFERINAARISIIEPEAQALATARLADQLKDKPTTPAHAETQRKSATKLLSPSPSPRGTGVPLVTRSSLSSSIPSSPTQASPITRSDSNDYTDHPDPAIEADSSIQRLTRITGHDLADSLTRALSVRLDKPMKRADTPMPIVGVPFLKGSTPGENTVELDAILRQAHEADASDIHIVSNELASMRVHQVIKPMAETKMDPQVVMNMFKSMVGQEILDIFARDKDADFSYEIAGLARYRVNAHMQKGVIGLAMRAIKSKVPPLSALSLPEVIARLTYLPRGLVLVTGDTGSGKSTTLAAMIQSMNQRYSKHIITLEDPVEYMFESDRCLIEQRELGRDMISFSSGLKHALRQDPDIILVGEMRDLETASLAISAGETGHLVLSTLHTVNASQTVSRIIDMYPSGQQSQIRSMLSTTLQAVVSQTLFTRSDRPGMVPAVETLLCTPAVRNLIRENKIFEIPNVIETSRAIGMCSLDSSIAELYFNGTISKEDAIAKAVFPDKLERQLVA